MSINHLSRKKSGSADLLRKFLSRQSSSPEPCPVPLWWTIGVSSTPETTRENTMRRGPVVLLNMSPNGHLIASAAHCWSWRTHGYTIHPRVLVSAAPATLQWHTIDNPVTPIQSRCSAYKSAAQTGPEKNRRTPSTTPDSQITNAVFCERRTMRPPRSLKIACSHGDRQRSTGTETGNRSHSFSFFFRTW